MGNILYKLFLQLLAGFAVGASAYLFYEDTLKPMSESQWLHVLLLYLICALFARLTVLVASRSAEARIRSIYPLGNMPKVEPVLFHWGMAILPTWIILNTQASSDIIDMPWIKSAFFGIFLQWLTFVISCIGWTFVYSSRYSLPAFDAFSARSRNPFNNNYD
jgi:hypothetical protein